MTLTQPTIFTTKQKPFLRMVFVLWFEYDDGHRMSII